MRMKRPRCEVGCVAYAPPGLVRVFTSTHGLRRGLQSFAASRLAQRFFSHLRSYFFAILFCDSSFLPSSLLPLLFLPPSLFRPCSFFVLFSSQLLGDRFVAHFWVLITTAGPFIYLSCPASTFGGHTGIPVVKGSKCCRDFRLQGAFRMGVRSVENLVELKTEFRIALGIDRVVGFAGACGDGLKL